VAVFREIHGVDYVLGRMPNGAGGGPDKSMMNDTDKCTNATNPSLSYQADQLMNHEGHCLAAAYVFIG